MTGLSRRHILRRVIFTIPCIVLPCIAPALAQSTASTPPVDCFDDLFCIEPVQRGDTVDVFLSSMMDWNLSVEVDIELDNMSADRALPASTSLNPHERYRLVRLLGGRRGGQWSYRYSLKWLLGNINAAHDETHIYELPWAPGQTFGVGQGYDGEQTHKGRMAIDWDMPVGTPVHAARGGIVVDFQDKFYEGGESDDLQSRANFVTVLHDDGTLGQYVHLDYQGVRVQIGEKVDEGDVLGLSGDTGYSSGPHLHFEVYTVTSKVARRTVPVRFRTNSESAVTLTTGNAYTH